MNKRRYLRYFEDEDLLIGSFRYFLGRMTIATVEYAKNLAASWDELPEKIKGIISRELEDAFRQDDIDRENNSNYKHLGMDCDRESWELVRKKYKGN